MNSADCAGWRWYSDARAIVAGLADIYARPPTMVAGVIAVCSQREEWRRNVRKAERALRGEGVPGMRIIRDRALRILAGEAPLDVLRGPKIRAFYRALMGNDNAVVIDTWMCRHYRHSEKPTLKQYKKLAQRVRREAERREIPPATWQAILWCRIKAKGA